MKKAFLLVVILGFGLIVATPAYAVCSVDRESRIFPKTVTVQGTTLDVSGKTYDLPASRCTGKQPDGVYTLWCDTQSEANAYDSIIVPLCGSSVELGKANSSCWTCGSDYRCAGLSFGLGETDSFINTIHGQVNQGDTNTDQVWRITHDQVQQNLNTNGKFVFNGHEYDPPNGDLIVCNANVLGCGASDVQCTSALYPTEKFEQGTGNLPLTTEGIPIRHPNVAITDLNTVPGNTAITVTDQRKWGASGLGSIISSIVTSFLKFPVINNQPKTSESNLNTEMETVLGTLDPGWNAQGRLSGADQGGKLMPLMLSENSLSWPIEKEGSLMTEKYAKRTCSWFGANKPSGLTGVVSPTMAETEVLKPDLPITLSGWGIWGALFGTQYTDETPGLPTLNIGTPRQEWGVFDEQNQEIHLKPELYDLMYDCGDATSRRKNNYNLFTVLFSGLFGLGGGSATGASPYQITSGPNDVLSENDCSGLECILRFFIPQTTESTITIGSDGHPALFSTVLGGEHILGSGNQDANLEDFSKNYRGYARTFLSTMTQQDLRILDYHNFAHADTDLPNPATVTIMGSGQSLDYVTHAGVASAKDGFIAQQCAISPLSKQTELFGSGKCDEVLEKTGGTKPDVPSGVIAFAQNSRPSGFYPQGVLGEEFLKKFEQTLITAQLTPQQRALLMQRIQELINQYVATGQWPNSQLGNTDFQNQIRDFAQANGFNEAFLYALWLEETHASSLGDYPFGCGGYTDFGTSLNCLANDPTVQTYIRGPLPEALCMYADGHYPCDFTDHPDFIRNFMYYYDYLTQP